MTLRIAKYERHYDLSYEIFKAKSKFVYNVKNAFGLQEHDYCSDCGVDLNHPILGECTDDCRCTEWDCRTLHVQNEASEGCDCEHCQDHWRDIADTLRKQEQESRY